MVCCSMYGLQKSLVTLSNHFIYCLTYRMFFGYEQGTCMNVSLSQLSSNFREQGGGGNLVCGYSFKVGT